MYVFENMMCLSVYDNVQLCVGVWIWVHTEDGGGWWVTCSMLSAFFPWDRGFHWTGSEAGSQQAGLNSPFVPYPQALELLASFDPACPFSNIHTYPLLD